MQTANESPNSKDGPMHVIERNNYSFFDYIKSKVGPITQQHFQNTQGEKHWICPTSTISASTMHSDLQTTKHTSISYIRQLLSCHTLAMPKY